MSVEVRLCTAFRLLRSRAPAMPRALMRGGYWLKNVTLNQHVGRPPQDGRHHVHVHILRGGACQLARQRSI
jgi:hypothetical protein